MPAGIYKRTDKHLSQLAEARKNVPKMDLSSKEWAERKLLQKREWRQRDPEKARRINRTWAKKHPEKVREMYLNWKSRNADKVKDYQKRYKKKWAVTGKFRAYDLKKYNLTVEEYDRLLELQNCACAICGIEESKLPRRLFVDHCHSTGKIRGLLCSNCNFVLGYARDNIDVLFSAVNYLSS